MTLPDVPEIPQIGVKLLKYSFQNNANDITVFIFLHFSVFQKSSDINSCFDVIRERTFKPSSVEFFDIMLFNIRIIIWSIIWIEISVILTLRLIVHKAHIISGMKIRGSRKAPRVFRSKIPDIDFRAIFGLHVALR